MKLLLGLTVTKAREQGMEKRENIWTGILFMRLVRSYHSRLYGNHPPPLFSFRVRSLLDFLSIDSR